MQTARLDFIENTQTSQLREACI